MHTYPPGKTNEFVKQASADAKAAVLAYQTLRWQVASENWNVLLVYIYS